MSYQLVRFDWIYEFDWTTSRTSCDQQLTQKIPYYELRHLIRPGLVDGLNELSVWSRCRRFCEQIKL